MIAALFVATNGCYYGLPDVDPWDEQRDARLYAGPWPVVAHPPCAAWEVYGLSRPLRAGGWTSADSHGGWTCQVDQAQYGHLTIKPTWLYAFGAEPPDLIWGEAPAGRKLVSALPGPSEKRRRMIRTGAVQRLSRSQRIATPLAFRDLLLGIARTAQARTA